MAFNDIVNFICFICFYVFVLLIICFLKYARNSLYECIVPGLNIICKLQSNMIYIIVECFGASHCLKRGASEHLLYSISIPISSHKVISWYGDMWHCLKSCIPKYKHALGKIKHHSIILRNNGYRMVCRCGNMWHCLKRYIQKHRYAIHNPQLEIPKYQIIRKKIGYRMVGRYGNMWHCLKRYIQKYIHTIHIPKLEIHSKIGLKIVVKITSCIVENLQTTTSFFIKHTISIQLSND